MTTTKITLLGIYMFVLFFLLLVAFYDVARCVFNPSYAQFAISNYPAGSLKWYWDLFQPNFILAIFCLPKLVFMKKFASAGETGTIWNPIFYFAFAILITVAVLVCIEIFDTKDIEIIQNV